MFNVNIFTPSKIVALDVEVESLLIPTNKGQINILNNHTHIISKLESGHLQLFLQPKERNNYFVSDGICKVLDNHISILASVAEKASDIDYSRAEKSFKKYKDILSNSSLLTDEEINECHCKVKRAQQRMVIAKL